MIAFHSPPEGLNRVEVESVEAGLKVVTDYDPAEPGGKGRVLSTASDKAEEVAKLTYDAEGLATITFLDGSTIQARLF
ncbi:hypothetical protein D3C72_2419490 [compost metagenome]